jgi:2-C-methyl-D-erythritol 4-phosphate cytidylyltransferase
MKDLMGKVIVLIPAAGGGSRMGAGKNKLFLEIGGVPVIVRTVRAFQRHPSVDRVVLVTAAADREMFTSLLDAHGIARPPDITSGGASRQESVFNGLRYLSETAAPDDLVLIQDGARCFTDHATISRCIAQSRRSGACCAAVRLKDTIKLAEADGTVAATPDRTLYWMIQTPQAFRFGLIWQAYQEAAQKSVIGTDDASLAEAAGFSVTLVEGSYRNIKITTPDDLLFGEAIARDALLSGQGPPGGKDA